MTPVIEWRQLYVTEVVRAANTRRTSNRQVAM